MDKPEIVKEAEKDINIINAVSPENDFEFKESINLYKSKCSFYLTEEGEALQYSEVDCHSKVSTSSSVYADSGISLCSNTHEDHADEPNKTEKESDISKTRTRVSLDESKRYKDGYGLLRPNSRHRRSCSLPDILDVENYKIDNVNDSHASSYNIDQSDDVMTRVSVSGVSVGSNFRLSRPICGKVHIEDPCYVCLKYNEIYCNTCVQVHNFHCKEKVKFIPEIAPELRTTLCRDTIRELRSMKERFTQIKTDTETNLNNLRDMRKNFLISVMQIKNSIIQIMDTVEKEALLEMDIIFNTEKRKMDENLKELEEEIAKIVNHLDKIKDNASEENQIIFDLQSALKHSKAQDSKIHDLHKGIIQVELTFKPADELKHVLAKRNKNWKLGKTEALMCKFPYPCSCDRPYLYRTVGKDREFSARLHGWSFDREKCCITGCQFLENGNILMCDNNNKKVKLFDKRYKCTSVLNMHSSPWDVTSVDDDTAVVSLPDRKQIQFIGVTPKLSLKHNILLENNCWGVSYSNNRLFVTCWSRDTSEILVVDLIGNPERRIETVLGVPLHTPWYVAPRNDLVYISDWGTYTISCMTVAGSAVQLFRKSNLVGPLGMTVDPDGNVYVCGRDSNNIHIFSSDGGVQKVILSEKDGISQPVTVCHGKADDRLAVTSWMSDKVQIYRLN